MLSGKRSELIVTGRCAGRCWGTCFLNVASLSRHHMPRTALPISRRLTFTPGNADPKAERTNRLDRPFEW